MKEMKPSLPNSSALTPLTFLERAATVYSDHPSVVYNSTTYTWSQTHRRCLQLASSLSSLINIQRRDVVSVLAPNTPAMYELQFAIPMSGAVLNTVNTRLDAKTVSLILRHGESKLLFVDAGLVSLALEALFLFPADKPPPRLVLIDDDDVADVPPAVDFVGTYEDLVTKGDPQFEWVRPVSDWDPIVLNYTSGTTSAPKGVVHCHRGVFLMSLDSLVSWSVPIHPVYLWTLPMFHANGWTYTWGMAAVGGTNICLRKFTGSTIFNMIENHGVTHMCAASVVLNMLTISSTDLITTERKKLTHSVHILTGGSQPPAPVLHLTELLGFIVSHGYGMTETAGVAVSCVWKNEWNGFPAKERARLKSRQGVQSVSMTEVAVVDPATGSRVKPDGSSVGEVVMQGPSVMLGYLKDPAGTAACMKGDGWFYTGDVAVMHPDGYLEIKDRSKDVIISGGENLSSVEVETVLYEHPAVNEAAVVGRPDEFWGETPCAFVSLKARATEKDIIEHCRAALPRYLVPKTVVFKDELPKTSTGKIQKFVLREIARAMGSLSSPPSSSTSAVPSRL